MEKVKLLKLSDWRNAMKIKSTKLLATIRSRWLPMMRKFTQNARLARACAHYTLHTAHRDVKSYNGESWGALALQWQLASTIDSHSFRVNVNDARYEEATATSSIHGSAPFPHGANGASDGSSICYTFDFAISTPNNFIARSYIIKSVHSVAGCRSTVNLVNQVRVCGSATRSTHKFVGVCMNFITLLLSGEWRNDRISVCAENTVRTAYGERR